MAALTVTASSSRPPLVSNHFARGKQLGSRQTFPLQMRKTLAQLEAADISIDRIAQLRETEEQLMALKAAGAQQSRQKRPFVHQSVKPGRTLDRKFPVPCVGRGQSKAANIAVANRKTVLKPLLVAGPLHAIEEEQLEVAEPELAQPSSEVMAHVKLIAQQMWTCKGCPKTENARDASQSSTTAATEVEDFDNFSETGSEASVCTYQSFFVAST